MSREYRESVTKLLFDMKKMQKLIYFSIKLEAVSVLARKRKVNHYVRVHCEMRKKTIFVKALKVLVKECKTFLTQEEML